MEEGVVRENLLLASYHEFNFFFHFRISCFGINMYTYSNKSYTYSAFILSTFWCLFQSLRVGFKTWTFVARLLD